MTSTQPAEGELAEARDALRRREAELAASREQAAGLSHELEETSRGLMALYAELEDARQAAARLAAIVEWSDDAMFSLTADETIRTWNPGAERLLGYSATEITGRAASELAAAGLTEEFSALLERARAGELDPGHQTRSLRSDGSVVDVSVTCSAMRDEGGTVTGFSVVLRDITARLAVEAELATARAEREILAERDRMARDLHDSVIQRIFAAGMALQTAARLTRNPQATARIEAVIGDLDTSIAELREAIYTLHRPRARPVGLPEEIITLTSQAVGTLGFTPSVSFTGPDLDVPDSVSGHLLAVLREALSNIARHASASAVEVTVSSGSELVLRVNDNGRGMGDVTRSSGLRNMRERAEILGGTFLVTSEQGIGTQLEWRIPLDEA
jgi:two-component system sensor histidine kinase DevS